VEKVPERAKHLYTRTKESKARNAKTELGTSGKQTKSKVIAELD